MRLCPRNGTGATMTEVKSCTLDGCPGIGWETQGGLCTPCFRAAGQERKSAVMFPEGSEDLWFVSAVPFAIEFMRRFHDQSSVSLARRVLAAMIADLEMGEISALDMVRTVCIASVSREKVH